MVLNNLSIDKQNKYREWYKREEKRIDVQQNLYPIVLIGPYLKRPKWCIRYGSLEKYLALIYGAGEYL